MKHISIIGSGVVGVTLANGFRKRGYDVTMGTRKATVEGWDGAVASPHDAVAASDIVVIAVKGTVVEALVREIASALSGKVVIDATNPIAETPPTNGVLHFFTTLEDSLMERLQGIAPSAKFVKAFNSIGSAFMVNPDFNGQKPTMFICGNDGDAKKVVTGILEVFGFEVEDMGGVEGARAIEPLCMLWCIPGMLRGQWSHAFRLLKK